MTWLAFEYQGAVYDLSHLSPFEWKYTAPAGDKRPERTYHFHVSFSFHCFTRDPRLGESVDELLWYEAPHDRRLFCFDRYKLSKRLPEIIRSLPERRVWITHHANYFVIEALDSEGYPMEYEIYFTVTRATRRGWLNLVVQSAYVRTPGYKTSQPKKRKIRLDVIAFNTMSKKPINPPR